MCCIIIFVLIIALFIIDWEQRTPIVCELANNISFNFNCSTDECNESLHVYFANVIIENRSIHNLCGEHKKYKCCENDVEFHDDCQPFSKLETIQNCWMDKNGKIFSTQKEESFYEFLKNLVD